MNNMEIWDKVKDTPQEAKKTITGGKLNGFTDINPMWRLRRLTELFGPCGMGWKYEVTGMHTVNGADGELMAFAGINLYVKDLDGVWSAPIPGYGGSMLIDKNKNGLQCNDDGYKMALSDAIGTACKALGMSEDVYMSGSGGSKYGSRGQTPPPAPAAPPQNPTAAADTIITFGKYKGMTIRQIWAKDKEYLSWLASNDRTDPAILAAVQMVLRAAANGNQ